MLFVDFIKVEILRFQEEQFYKILTKFSGHSLARCPGWLQLWHLNVFLVGPR